MAEIIGIIWLTRIVSRIVVRKGYSKWYAAFVPGVWFFSETVVMLALVILAPSTNPYVLMMVALAGGVAGGAVVYFLAKNAPARTGAADTGTGEVAVSNAPVRVRRAPASGKQALVGYCDECGTNVWLTADGGCENGHGQDSISGVHWALR